jgi:hypothetical protein
MSRGEFGTRYSDRGVLKGGVFDFGVSFLVRPDLCLDISVLSCSHCGNEIALLSHLDLSYASCILIILQKKYLLGTNLVI